MGILDTDRRILALAFARMADSIGNSFLIVVLPLYIASGVVSGGTFGLSTALVTGLILSAFGFFMSGVQPIAGNLSDKTGKRKAFVVAGLLILAVSNFTYSLAGSYGAMLLIRIGQGIGVAVTVPATIALVNDLSTDDTRGGSMGVFNTFRMLGFGIGPVAAGTVIYGGPYAVLGYAVTGFEAAFYIATLGALVGAILVFALVSDPDIDIDAENTADAGGEHSVAVFERDGNGVLDSVFTLGIASLFMAIGIAILAPLESIINQHLGQSATLFGIEFAAFTLGQVVTQTPVGTASDRYGRKPFILAGLVLLVPATLAQGLVATPVGMVAARFVQGIAGAMVFAPAFALAGDIARNSNAGTTLSVLTMAFGLGTAIGPLAGGWLVGFGYVVPFAFAAALATFGLVLVYTQVEETHAGESLGEDLTRVLLGRDTQPVD
ncbi:major facilitator superfamily MFS_1 [Haladaptatus paucihalophilus DX253]|uniref:Major facilitator superfamily MFS_1 n=1 Tax=Haladaptatus paucihalophilus DX253 TaxID=797209 RepID=E7QZ86_HALPU|nr:MFS transporter [Haladaptatus paucihalophilus]EFW90007.1 major facilitator superfamily MFS_1 [Haladaptatus paucihalophilus DX253]SHL02452.1 Predicted arabinose efflux permease, MFS family [Haladaptatus paucihalophilus DX253]